ncbi:AAA family ATPase [Novosphingobium sp.]|uniref:AAA family ATPase n=1 Tax=Novosphingobium sp. TaxID=1874826 RepID=UPI003568C85D
MESEMQRKAFRAKMVDKMLGIGPIFTVSRDGGGDFLNTSIKRRLVTRMHRTHERRRASVFIGPPGIGKTTAAAAFMQANPNNVAYYKVAKTGMTGPQALQQLLLALRKLSGKQTKYVTNATLEVQRYIDLEIESLGGGLLRSDAPDRFPHLTVIFDEAQRLTHGAIDALRDYNEPHYFCSGAFPIGLIFIGNEHTPLEVRNDGKTIFDEGMTDRLLYRERLTYDDLERSDVELFVRSLGVDDNEAVNAVVTLFSTTSDDQRSLRRVSDFTDLLHDEAMGEPITAATVRAVLGVD